MWTHPVVPRVNDELKKFHAFPHRNQRAHQLLNVLVVCATATTPLKVQQMKMEFTSSRKAESGPGSFIIMLRTWLSMQPSS